MERAKAELDAARAEQREMLPQPDGILPPHGASNHHDPYLLIPKDLISLREGRNSLSLIPGGHGEAQQHQHRSPREMEIIGPGDAGGTHPRAAKPALTRSSRASRGQESPFPSAIAPREPQDAPGFAP